MTISFLYALFALFALANAQERTVESRARLLTRETAFGTRRNLGFKNWVRNRWKETVQSVESFAEVTGLDHAVHKVSGGDRIFNEDGSYNNELLQNAVSNTVVAIEDAFSKTGLDKIVHGVTGGCRVVDRNGGYNSECEEDLKDLARDIMKGPFIAKAKEILEDIKKGGVAIGDLMKNSALTSEEFDFLKRIMKADVKINSTEDRKKLGNILKNRILQVVDQIRNGIGLVDGQRPVLAFGMGLDCGASYIVSGSTNLNMFTKIPVFDGELLEVSITSSTSVGIGAEMGAACSQPYHFSFNTDPSTLGGLGVTVSITSVAYGGIKVDVGFALMKNMKFKISTISMALAVGVEFGVSVSLTHTTVIDSIKNVPADPVSDEIEKPANWCADKGGVCECNGFVRFGSDDKWHVLDQPIQGSIGCNTVEFGDPFPGHHNFCQCMPELPCGDNGNNYGRELLRKFTGSSCLCAAACEATQECWAWTYIPDGLLAMGSNDCVLRTEFAGVVDNCGGRCRSGADQEKLMKFISQHLLASVANFMG